MKPLDPKCPFTYHSSFANIMDQVILKEKTLWELFTRPLPFAFYAVTNFCCIGVTQTGNFISVQVRRSAQSSDSNDNFLILCGIEAI